MHYSPLRYPGGKTKLTPFLKGIFLQNNLKNITYVEPFAGGAGLALSLLFEGAVDNIIINDYDKSIYSFWRAILTETDAFIHLLQNTPINISEWNRQKKIYMCQNSKYSLELAFATFYLNRTNRSGIINARPIGGLEQSGNYKIDARFNKSKLEKKIREISKYKNNIYVFNSDVRSFMSKHLPKFGENVFIYFDPPYYNKGRDLYKNFFTNKDHKEIRDIISLCNNNWLLTYDNTKEIQELYSGFSIMNYDLRYSVSDNRNSSEIIILKDSLSYPSKDWLKLNTNINLRSMRENYDKEY